MDKRNELVKWAATKIGKSFVWGKCDCTTVTLEGVRLYYDIDFGIDRKWKSFMGALKTYKKYGEPPGLLKEKGFVEIQKNFEQTGDIFVWKGKGYWLIGIVINSSVLVVDEGKTISMRPIYNFKEDYMVYGMR